MTSKLWLILPFLIEITACSAPIIENAKDPADFETRCADPQVIRCFGFEASELSTAGGPIQWSAFDAAVGVFVNGFDNGSDLAGRVEIANDEKASGSTSLKFHLPSMSGPGHAGQFYANFADDYSIQFAESDEFYIQWRQRFSSEFLDNRYYPQNGWKQLIVGEGDSPISKAWSCTQLELVVNRGEFGTPSMYHSCGGKDGLYESIEPRWFVNYRPNQWMTFQLHVKIGTWYQNDNRYRRDSVVELSVTPECGMRRAVIYEKLDIANENSAAAFGKVWLTPFLTDKDSTQKHPDAYTWYDELIISRDLIAEPAPNSENDCLAHRTSHIAHHQIR